MNNFLNLIEAHPSMTTFIVLILASLIVGTLRSRELQKQVNILTARLQENQNKTKDALQSGTYQRDVLQQQAELQRLYNQGVELGVKAKDGFEDEVAQTTFEVEAKNTWLQFQAFWQAARAHALNPNQAWEETYSQTQRNFFLAVMDVSDYKTRDIHPSDFDNPQ